MKILHGLLSRAYNIDNGKIEELLKDLNNEDSNQEEILNKILELDAQRVERIKSSVDTSGKFQEGYAKAKKEERSIFENEIKKAFGIDESTNIMGVDLVKEIVKQSSPNEVNEDTIKRHPVFQSRESELRNQIDTIKREYEDKINEINRNHVRSKTLSDVKQKAVNIFESLNPVLASDSKVAANQKSLFLQQFDNYEYEIQDDRVVVLKDGKVLEDQHGNSVNFNDLVQEKTMSLFELRKNNGGGNAGNDRAEGDPVNVQMPKNEDELFEIMNDESIDLDKRIEIADAYNKNK